MLFNSVQLFKKKKSDRKGCSNVVNVEVTVFRVVGGGTTKFFLWTWSRFVTVT